MTFITLIPVIDNDGNRFPREIVREVLDGLAVRFNGFTVLGRTRGTWIDSRDGRWYRDLCHRVMVACDDDRLADAEAAVVEIGRKLGQIEMYFEVRTEGEVKMLPVA